MNRLRKAVRDYLTMRRGLGFKLVRHEAGLQEFVSFLECKRGTHITVGLALEWATQHTCDEPYEWAALLTIVRGFARHWSTTDPATEVPPLGLLPYRPPRAQPYFYSNQEIRELLKAAKNRPSIDPLRAWTYHCLFGLLAVTGLRLGEALNLRIADIDWREGILTIRGAKFGKSRLVPLHASTRKVLADYARRRDRRFATRPEGCFLVNKNGNRLDKGEVHRVFYILSRQIGLRAIKASRGPRLHDFRHRFAVETLLRNSRLRPYGVRLPDNDSLLGQGVAWLASLRIESERLASSRIGAAGRLWRRRGVSNEGDWVMSIEFLGK